MKGITRKTKITCSIALAALIISCVIAIGVGYAIEVYKQRLDATQVETKRILDERNRLDSLEKVAAETKDDRAELEHYILKDSDVIGFLSLIEHTATNKAVHVTTHTIATAPEGGKNGFNTLTVELELSGSESNVKTIIDLYEHLPYQLRIEKLALDRTSVDVDSWHANVVLKVTELPS